MKIEKLQMPYLLASQHQLIHASCLVTCLWFNAVRDENIKHEADISKGITLAFRMTIIMHTFCLLIEIILRVIEYK